MESKGVRRAYTRGEYWDERVGMMQFWSDHLDHLRDGAKRYMASFARCCRATRLAIPISPPSPASYSSGRTIAGMAAAAGGGAAPGERKPASPAAPAPAAPTPTPSKERDTRGQGKGESRQ